MRDNQTAFGAILSVKSYLNTKAFLKSLALSAPLWILSGVGLTLLNELPAKAQLTKTAAATATATNRRIVLSLSQRRVDLFQGNMLISSYPVAVGTPEMPTPSGEFQVSKMVVDPVWENPWTGEITPPGPNSALGLRWIEFATSEAGAFGFHGTPTLDSIGQAASNGCVRMRNEDVVALFSQVSVGTPVIIQ